MITNLSKTYLGKKITSAKTADIYHNADATAVIKLFHKQVPIDLIERERTMYRFIKTHKKIPAPCYIRDVKIDDREGMELELIKGTTLTSFIRKKPWLLRKVLRTFVETQLLIHKHNAESLSLPVMGYSGSSTVFCHGDYHFDNVMISDGRCVVIDWMNAGKGSSLYDVCRTYFLLKAPSTARFRGYRFFANYLKEYIAYTYLSYYCKLSGVDKQKVVSYTSEVAKARIQEGVLVLEAEWWADIAKKG